MNKIANHKRIACVRKKYFPCDKPNRLKGLKSHDNYASVNSIKHKVEIISSMFFSC